MAAIDPAQAFSFGAAADAYERGRPTYPEEAVGWLVPAGAHRVADVGAGTGKLTRLLLGRGLDVVAVEPDPGMRAQLARAVPGVPVLAGTAEQLPLPDQSVDAVLLAQAWHWVDPARAVPEAARVLAPGGRLGMVWNLRDERVAWVAELGRIVHGDENTAQDRAPEPGPPFGPAERFSVHWVNELSRSMLLDMVASRSYVITRPPAERTAILRDVQRLLDTHPAVAGTGLIELPYVTVCFRATLAP